MSIESIKMPSGLMELFASAPIASTAIAALSILYIRHALPSLPTTGPIRPKELLEALERKNEDVYYFGVGSNLSRTRIENRSVCGKMIHPITMEPCYIKDCRLAFNYMTCPPLEPAFGSVEPLPSFYGNRDAKKEHPVIVERSESQALLPYKKNECHGALIKLSAEDYGLVYRSEGGDLGALSGYYEIMVTCVPYDKSKPPVKAVAYRVRDHFHAKVDRAPSKRYMDILRMGAAELGLVESYQAWLKDHPVQNPSNIVKQVGKYNMIFVFTLTLGLGMPTLGRLQSAILFKAYVLPTEAKWRQVLCEVVSVVVMLPTACFGLALRRFLEYSGLMPSEMKKWMESLD